MTTLLLATTNAHKCREIEAFLETVGHPGLRVSCPERLPHVVENGATFLENAHLKANAARVFLGDTDFILAEDSGLVIPALAGSYGLDPFPGVRSNRWMTEDIRGGLLGDPLLAGRSALPDEDVCWEDINAAVLALMRGVDDRSAYYVCAMVLLRPGGLPAVEVEAEMPLQVIPDGDRPRGIHGFGYDPIMQPVVDGRMASHTVAQMLPEEKNRISHRGKALQQILQYLPA